MLGILIFYTSYFRVLRNAYSNLTFYRHRFIRLFLKELNDIPAKKSYAFCFVIIMKCGSFVKSPSIFLFLYCTGVKHRLHFCTLLAVKGKVEIFEENTT